jgi:hypothetical protein
VATTEVVGVEVGGVVVATSAVVGGDVVGGAVTGVVVVVEIATHWLRFKLGLNRHCTVAPLVAVVITPASAFAHICPARTATADPCCETTTARTITRAALARLSLTAI